MLLGLLDNRELERNVNWTLLSDPLYAELEKLTTIRRLAPRPNNISELGHNASLFASVHSADALFAMHGNWRPEWSLLALSMSAFPKVKAAWFVDPWPFTLNRIDKACRLLRMDIAFIPYREAYEALHSERGGERYVYLPYAADTTIFCNSGQERDIDILWMGRKDEPLHRALMVLSERHGLNYLYRERTGFLDDPRDLGALAARSRYFVVTPPATERSGGFSPLVMRYLEGLSAGCRLLGTRPKSGEFEALFPRGALLEVREDGSDLEALYSADQNDAQAWSDTKKAICEVRAKHGWNARAKTILQHISAKLGQN